MIINVCFWQYIPWWAFESDDAIEGDLHWKIFIKSSAILMMIWQVSFYQLRHIWPIVNGRQEAESHVCFFFRCKKNTIYTVHRICVLGVTQPWIFLYPICLEFSFGAGNNPDKGSIIIHNYRDLIYLYSKYRKLWFIFVTVRLCFRYQKYKIFLKIPILCFIVFTS